MHGQSTLLCAIVNVRTVEGVFIAVVIVLINILLLICIFMTEKNNLKKTREEDKILSNVHKKCRYYLKSHAFCSFFLSVEKCYM